MPPTVLAVFGPTGVGKTALALALADGLRARGEDPVAISADALQVYRGLEVLTGAATAQERERLEHRLVGIVDVTHEWSVAEHAGLAHADIDAALSAGRRPIVVGGTGLYLRATLAELHLQPRPPAELRERLAARARDEGAPVLHAELAAVAPAVAARIEPRDSSRVIRALELHELGVVHGEHDAGHGLWTEHTRHATRLVGLVMDREALRERIGARVDAMVAAGAREEVLAADAVGASATARAALGFRQLLEGDVDAMKRHTRQYARRQLTWLRKLPAVELVDVTDREPDDVAREILG